MNQLHFGVCIGIDRYPGFPGRDLGSARGDARNFANGLLAANGGGLPPDNVKVIEASPEEIWAQAGDARPQLREFDRALATFNRRLRDYLDATPDDPNASRLYVYASGHGIGPVDGECGVLMASADLDTLGDHAELSKYRSWYEGYGPFREVVVFADCCRELLDVGIDANGPPFPRDGLPVGARTFTGYASRLGETAWEPASAADRDTARGYFTDALLKGLRSGPIDPRYGVVTSTTLAKFVADTVLQLTQGQTPYPQKAESKGDPANPILFGTTVAPAPSAVSINFPEGFTGDVVLRSGPGEQLGSWNAAEGPWVIELPPGHYEVVPVTPAGPTDWLFKVAGADVDVRL